MTYIKPITISEFRKNTKALLDLAKEKDIYIGRGWEVFKLTHEGGTQHYLPPKVKEKVATHPKPINIDKPEDVVDAVLKVFPNSKLEFCKNGHPIPVGRDKCLGKSCKYA